jgi:hypothetical protein
VLDLASGKALRSLALPAPAYRVWATDDGRVGLTLENREDLLFEPTTGAMEQADPKSVPFPEHPFGHLKDLPAPTIDGLDVSRTLREGALAVAAGKASEGDLPRAVGFDPDTGDVRWTWDSYAVDPGRVRARSNRTDDLRHGLYATIYGTTDHRWRLLALDAASGQKRWDSLLPDIFAVDKADRVVVGATSVYVLRTSSVDVVRASDGAYLGSIGEERYE